MQVGALGFAIDAGVLWLLIYEFGTPPVLARGISFVLTICITFVFNAQYTFAVNPRSASMTRYIVVQVLGAAINFAVYTWLVLYGPLNQYPLVALVIGSIFASTHNFIMLRKFVFNDTRPSGH